MFHSALAAHKGGRLQEAEQGYSAILQTDPRHADALHLLGLIRSERGALNEAESLIRAAVDIRENANFLCNLGNVLADQGKLPAAEAAFSRAAEIAPSYALAHHNLGTLLMDAQRFDEAEAAFARAIEQDPDLVEAVINLGVLQMERGRLDEAEASFRHACAVDPCRSNAYRDLGLVLMRMNRLAEAEVALRRSLSIAPDDSATCNSLGTLLLLSGRGDEGETQLRRAIELAPHNADAHYNLGTRYMQTHRLPEAEKALRRAIELSPGRCDARMNLGNVLACAGRPAEAEAVYRQAIELQRDSAGIQWNLSQVLLKQGQYAEGWRLFESRLDARVNVDAPPLPFPRWRGEPLSGKSLLVCAEQGLGDTLQFCRYLTGLKRQGLAKLSVLCPPTLIALLETIEEVDHCIAFDGSQVVPAHDWWCLFMSLPFHFGTTMESIPASMPYLRVPAARRSRRRHCLPPGKKMKVGLVWAGDPRPTQGDAHATDKRRSIACKAYLPLLQIGGITFVSLQKGDAAQAQLNDIPEALRPLDLMNEVRDFADTAAIIEQLDLVISVDTSTAHLAGALGKPVWILSRFDGCWRWLEKRDDSPWYPTARLFRQTEPGDWNDVIRRVAQALDEFVNANNHRPATTLIHRLNDHGVLGITLAGAEGIGDKLQFSSFPENYFRNTGRKVVDVDRVWIFDHNPYVVRDVQPDRIVNLWTQKWLGGNSVPFEDYRTKPVFSSLAERTSHIFGHVAYLRHPRLYRFEELPTLEKRIVLHTTGKNIPPHVALGEDHVRELSAEIISHVRDAYAGYEIVQVGSASDLDAQVIDCRGVADIWEVARLIAQARIYIGVDSGSYWIAACYPRIFRKKVMMQYPAGYLRDRFVPMHVLDPHSHWHDASCLYYNRTTDDAGVTYSYLKL
ncbi:tetratricopeptide repeat protein [Paraburkholderia sp. BCC1885]|uniref:tetratricopeptide repeat protein n=1 Tax=Paraburkholderia sp. BCC1885 TaxID=2562669 RepID=UPI001642FFF0|nr:tetratricopeptide repeat protein [Paraburkholderia sp. BCC1885]